MSLEAALDRNTESNNKLGEIVAAHTAALLKVAGKAAPTSDEPPVDTPKASEKRTQTSDKPKAGKKEKKLSHDDLMDFFGKFFDVPTGPKKTKRMDAIEKVLDVLGHKGGRIRDLPEDKWAQAIAYAKEFLDNGEIKFPDADEEDEDEEDQRALF